MNAHWQTARGAPEAHESIGWSGAPYPWELTPRQYREREIGAVIAEHQCTRSEAEYSRDEVAMGTRWLRSVRHALQSGQVLRPAILDRLWNLGGDGSYYASAMRDAPGARLPDGYVTPPGRKALRDEIEVQHTRNVARIVASNASKMAFERLPKGARFVADELISNASLAGQEMPLWLEFEKESSEEAVAVAAHGFSDQSAVNTLRTFTPPTDVWQIAPASEKRLGADPVPYRAKQFGAHEWYIVGADVEPVTIEGFSGRYTSETAAQRDAGNLNTLVRTGEIYTGPRTADPRAVTLVSERLRLSNSTVEDLLLSPEATLRQRDAYLANDDEMEPLASFPRHPISTARIQQTITDPRNCYVDFMTTFDSWSLLLAEPEDNIRHHPTYARYAEMSANGSEPPYITVFEHVRENGDRVLISQNRRRTLVAQDLNKPIDGWLGLHNDETGLPLRYGDVLDAYAEACAILGVGADGPSSHVHKAPPVETVADDELELESSYVVTVNCSRWSDVAYEIGEADANEVIVDRDTWDKDDLQRAGRKYGLYEASAPSPFEGPITFRSVTADEDRDHFELGVDTFYCLTVHEVDGRQPNVVDFQHIADALGVKFRRPLTAHPCECAPAASLRDGTTGQIREPEYDSPSP